MVYNAGKYSDIDIIVHVEKCQEEITENIKILDRLLTEEYYFLIDEKADSYAYLIDMHIIDDNLHNQRNSSRAYLEHIFLNESVAIG